MEGWKSGRMEGWKGGRWKSGRMEGWKDGRVEGWKDGRVEGWKGGSVEGWKGGRMEGWKGGSALASPGLDQNVDGRYGLGGLRSLAAGEPEKTPNDGYNFVSRLDKPPSPSAAPWNCTPSRSLIKTLMTVPAFTVLKGAKRGRFAYFALKLTQSLWRQVESVPGLRSSSLSPFRTWFGWLAQTAP